MTQDKAQSAVNGCSLNKGCNAVLSHLWASLRARREAIICGVTLLGKGAPFPAELSLIHISEPTRRRDSSRMPSSA